MKKLVGVVALCLASRLFALPDFIAPFDLRLIHSSTLFDTVEVTTYLINKGTTVATSPLYPSPYTAVSVGVDSFNIRTHDVYTLSAGFYLEFKDTITIIRGAHSFHTWCDPLVAFNESNVNNNVRSQPVNYHPAVVRDTIVLYDTLVRVDTLKTIQKDTVKIVERDTLRITERDTIRITLRDTIRATDTVRVVVRDTIYIPQVPSLAKASARLARPAVQTEVYNAIGQLVWSGRLRDGEYPPVRLKQGLHLLVQGSRAHRFRVAYR